MWDRLFKLLIIAYLSTLLEGVLRATALFLHFLKKYSISTGIPERNRLLKTSSTQTVIIIGTRRKICLFSIYYQMSVY